MKRTQNYIDQINKATDKNVLAGIRIAFSQDTALAWSEFMECYNAYTLRCMKLGF